ncbi:hypothetical protein M5K25_001017 [Dendrobium thyrsiflorum]|uniref:Secreted protein n=1 Tax=Dendrobium thyrsiflorum TaxID=117978 RepID=A0ABD0WBX7_DENTH
MFREFIKERSSAALERFSLFTTVLCCGSAVYSRSDLCLLQIHCVPQKFSVLLCLAAVSRREQQFVICFPTNFA